MIEKTSKGYALEKRVCDGANKISRMCVHLFCGASPGDVENARGICAGGITASREVFALVALLAR